MRRYKNNSIDYTLILRYVKNFYYYSLVTIKIIIYRSQIIIIMLIIICDRCIIIFIVTNEYMRSNNIRKLFFFLQYYKYNFPQVMCVCVLDRNLLIKEKKNIYVNFSKINLINSIF